MIMMQSRVISFIDGFNLYHAIERLHRPELKWLNLMALSRSLISSKTEILNGVYYFSAYPHHMSEPVQKRHRTYVKALELQNVQPVLGSFKEKDRKCTACHYRWKGHEEKQTDVNIALFLLDLAYRDAFDRALVISNDSDLVPAIRMVKERFSKKRITTVAPPHCKHSNELIKVSSDKTKINIEQLERCLLPAVIKDASRLISISRPEEYAPQVTTISDT
jgi:uncharacterized LabA/DUF88 family protein